MAATLASVLALASAEPAACVRLLDGRLFALDRAKTRRLVHVRVDPLGGVAVALLRLARRKAW